MWGLACEKYFRVLGRPGYRQKDQRTCKRIGCDWGTWRLNWPSGGFDLLKVGCGSQQGGEFTLGADPDVVAYLGARFWKELIGEEEDARDLIGDGGKGRPRAYIGDFDDPLFDVKVCNVKGEEAWDFWSYGDIGETYAEMRIATGSIHDKCKQLRWRLGIGHRDDPLTEQSVAGYVIDAIACRVHWSSGDE